MHVINKNHDHGQDFEADLMSGLTEVAHDNRHKFDDSSIFAVNIMSGPGAGKTTLLDLTVAELKEEFNIAIIEGDMTTEIDANRMRAHGVPVVAITTGRACHLDSELVANGLKELDLKKHDLLLIENVGNLVCPAEFPLGEHLKVALISVAEGDDKPLKYPVMFYEADCVIITKIDLLNFLDVNLDDLISNIKQINPDIPIFTLSAQTGEGSDQWLDWIQNQTISHTNNKEINL